MTWTPSRVATLRTLFIDQNLSASETAERMGVTKNTIIGKCQRLGIHKANETIWTAETVKVLERLFKTGQSHAEIAKQIPGSTRLSVCGKINRMGLARSEECWREAQRLSKKRRAKSGPKPKPTTAKAKPMPEKPKPVFLYEPVTLLDLTATTCRYPVSGEGGDTLFCAMPAGEVYCADHQKICWVPILRKMARDTERAVMRLSR